MRSATSRGLAFRLPRMVSLRIGYPSPFGDCKELAGIESGYDVARVRVRPFDLHAVNFLGAPETEVETKIALREKRRAGAHLLNLASPPRVQAYARADCASIRFDA